MNLRDIPDIDLTPPDYPEGDRYPTCDCCYKKIKSRFYFDIGEKLCRECLFENYRFETELYRGM